MVYSFDVFDTCLCRLCGDPRNVFEVLSLRVQQMMGDRCNEHMRQLFVVARVNSGGHNLGEIYKQVAERYPLPCSIEEMAQLELATESDMLSPIESTKQLINSLRPKGKIIFISDMYLPDDFICRQLSRHGFFLNGDQLYVSDSIGAWKHDGSLFRHIHETTSIPYRKWHHYGDNWRSDYQIPKRLGIHAHHLHYDYLHYEQQWKQQTVIGFQYPSILAGVSRAVRLQEQGNDEQKRFVTNISAPFMVSWTASTIQQAERRGIQKLFFLARDVHSEYLIAKQLSKNNPQIDCRYLFISSKSLYEDALSTDYLRVQGLNGNTPAAIVDSCSCGKTLHIINQQLGKQNCDALHGFLILKTHTQNCPMEDTADYLFDNYYLESMTKKKTSRISGMRVFFELLFSLNFHKTVIGYEYHGPLLRPVFGNDTNDQWHFDNIDSRSAKRNNDRLLLKFTDAFVRTGLHHYTDTILERLATPSLIDFVDHPRKEYLDYLHHFIWWGKPFVGTSKERKKAVWARGTRSYSLPKWILLPYYAVVSNAERRDRLNKLASLLSCHPTFRKK